MEVQILCDGELYFGLRFDTKALAVQWAKLAKQAIERGGLKTDA